MEWLLNMHVSVHVVELQKNKALLFAFSLKGCCGDMGDSEKSKMIDTSEMESFSLDAGRLSRDLLNRFMGSGTREGKFEFKDEDENEEAEIELNLGLSLGGRFGVDKTSRKLMRSSSVATYLPVVRDDGAAAASSPPVVPYPSLVRTSSLPVQTEEEWRKRKELQTLRRMEAKRRRSDKQRNLKAERESGGSSAGVGGCGIRRCLSTEEDKRDVEVTVRGRLEKDHFLGAAERFGSSVAPALGMSMLVAGQPILGSAVDVAMGKGKGSHLTDLSGTGMQDFGQPLSQGSVESHGGSSSSELESRTLRGSSSCGELSPVSIKSLREGSNEDVGSSGRKLREITSGTSGVELGNPSRQADITKSQRKETGKNALEEMPCVFTKGDGPNGRRVDGILYKYGKGEEVRIMCVCHGTFLSPAEFVRHAGGTDVTHPLKHIVVNPNASPFQ